MKNLKSQTISIPTNFTSEKLLGKLNRITAEEFHDAVKSPDYKYYGNISGNEFDIRNVKYGPHSNGPWIKGKVSEGANKVTVIIEVDIEEQIEILKKMMYPYFIFLGLLIMAIGTFIDEARLIIIAVGAFMMVLPFFQVVIIKRLLKSMQKEEMKQFTAIVSV